MNDAWTRYRNHCGWLQYGNAKAIEARQGGDACGSVRSTKARAEGFAQNPRISAP